MRIHLALVLAIAASACDSPPATQPEKFENVVNATQTDPGLLTGNEGMNYGEGNITPAERNNMGNAVRAQAQPGTGNTQQ